MTATCFKTNVSTSTLPKPLLPPVTTTSCSDQSISPLVQRLLSHALDRNITVDLRSTKAKSRSDTLKKGLEF
uniref:17-beta hydroxysteroid dehydrogenase 13 n=1 Tax=Phakopsora pachyrhizi TaxID=170000 RepID=A0A0S1MKJ2_PHAPC